MNGAACDTFLSVINTNGRLNDEKIYSWSNRNLSYTDLLYISELSRNFSSGKRIFGIYSGLTKHICQVKLGSTHIVFNFDFSNPVAPHNCLSASIKSIARTNDTLPALHQLLRQRFPFKYIKKNTDYPISTALGLISPLPIRTRWLYFMLLDGFHSWSIKALF